VKFRHVTGAHRGRKVSCIISMKKRRKMEIGTEYPCSLDMPYVSSIHWNLQ
jgi:hypothetical protein